MNDLPSLELIESVHSFPGRYTFKVIGRGDQGFVARVVAAVRDELAGSEDPPFSVRETSGGKHMAVTVDAMIFRSHDVLRVYRRLQTMAGLVMLW